MKLINSNLFESRWVNLHMITIVIDLYDWLVNDLRLLLFGWKDYNFLLLLPGGNIRLFDKRVLDVETHQQVVLHQTGLLLLAAVEVLQAVTGYYVVLESEGFDRTRVLVHLAYFLLVCAKNRLHFFFLVVFIYVFHILI